MRLINKSFIVFIALFTLTLFSCTAKKEIGLQLWSVRDNMKADPIATIERVGDIGYSFVEAAGYGDGKFYGMDPLEFKAALNDNGLKFLASHTGQALPDSSNWDEVMEWWDVCIDAHAAAGVSYIVQPFMDDKGYGSLADLKLFCDYFNAVGEKCNAKGIQFGYHNHDKEFQEVDGIRRYDFMLQNTDPEKVFFQIDLYWITVGGQKAVEYFDKYPGRFDLWHVKDEKELGGDESIMNFEPIFAKKEIAGMKHIVVEVERYSFDPLESVKLSHEFLMTSDFVK
ncbi:MAG: sugar phosphate isomerase/epimerase [Prolixibacteraceae bacterium]|jgi:sugar phosphate isomerase/epimerase|nr:sugar phosphate isomerase/epimerase [Prolixibacteraceae bacterium]